MQIRDLTEADLPAYFCCFEEWEKRLEPGKSFKQKWYEQAQGKGLRVKIAIDDDGTPCGMIQYLPVEHTHITGRDIYFIYCIWVHGHKQGIGNRQNKGMGKALLAAAEEDAKALGAKGVAAWGLRIPVWMKAAWFRKQGYKSAHSSGIMQLVFKAWAPDVPKPAFPKPKKKPAAGKDKVILTDFIDGWCTYSNVTHANAAKLAAEFPGKVELVTLDATDKEVLAEWGIGEGLYIDGKAVRTAPPLPYAALKSKVEKRIKRLRQD